MANTVESFSFDPAGDGSDLTHGDLDRITNVAGVGQQSTPHDTRFDDGSNVAQLTTAPEGQQGQPWQSQVSQLEPSPPSQPDPRDEEIRKLKQIMGDQGNQIGEYRKILANLAAAQQVPQPTYANPAPAGGRIFNRNPDEYLTAKETEEGLFKAAQVMYESLQAQIQEQAAKAQLLASGITPEEQQILELQYPGLRNMDPQTRVSVTSALVAARRAPAQAAAQAATIATAQVASQGVRQRVFVEPPQTVSNIPSQGVSFDMNAWNNMNSKQREDYLTKAGAGRVNDWGRRG